MAEVSLTFVNDKGILPIEYSELTITRRLYRSGDSEYLINGTSCRLKDIMELFMEIGTIVLSRGLQAIQRNDGSFLLVPN